MRRVVAAVLALGCSRAPQPAAQTQQAVTVAPRPAPVVEAPPAPPAPVALDADHFRRAVPPWDAATIARVRTLFGEGARAGNRPDVFAKIGDSITESGSFAQDIGHGWYELGAYSSLEGVVRHFRRRTFTRDAEDNSFTRGSLSATAGWTTESLLEGGDRSPLERELRATRPAFAVVMIGTNDAERLEIGAYRENLQQVLQRIEGHGVVPILSTIPEQRSAPEANARGHAVNDVIRATAAARHIPLIDYHAALEGLPNDGLCEDNVHPSVFVDHGDTRAGVFSDAALRHGYNVRNLILLMALERAMQAVGAEGAPRALPSYGVQ